MEELFVNFISGGEKIAGMLHIPEKTPAPAIIFCHGFTGHRIESHRLFIYAAREFCRKGFVVLRFDFRGSGESEGTFDSMTVSREVEDLENALDWIQDRTDVLKEQIGVVGLSLGGAVSLLTAAKDKRFKAVCTWSSPADLRLFKENAKNIFRETNFDKLIKEDYIDLLAGDRIGRGFLLDAMKKDVLKAVARISPRPLLIVHGTRDQSVPFSHAEKLFNAAGEPKETFFVDGADHTYNKWEWQWKVIDYTVGFFERNLKA
ncbi:MAG: alpha/beta hydrolase [Nitrososphaeria archaeon]|jgi:dipeptidyl aminopeptidase/acylaminoacyl peptidase